MNAPSFFDKTKFEYIVADLLPWKGAPVPALEQTGLRVICLDGGHGMKWITGLMELVHEHPMDLVHTHSPCPAVSARRGLGLTRPRFVNTECAATCNARAIHGS